MFFFVTTVISGFNYTGQPVHTWVESRPRLEASRLTSLLETPASFVANHNELSARRVMSSLPECLRGRGIECFASTHRFGFTGRIKSQYPCLA